MKLNKMIVGLNYDTKTLRENVNGLIEKNPFSFTKNMVVKLINEVVYVGYKINGKDLIWSLAQRGVNQTFTCNRAYLFEPTGSAVDLARDYENTTPYLGNIDTDWVGPYMCKLQSEPTNYTFVGGHHDKSGGTPPAGTPSSRSSGFQLMIDELEIENSDGQYNCAKLVAKTSNFVQTNNPASTQEILRQDVTFTITDLGVYVEIETTALDDIRIDRFYGIQCYAREGFSEVRFFEDQTSAGVLSADAAGNPEPNTVVRSILHYNLDGNVFSSFISNDSAGDFRYKSAGNPYASRTNYKSYFNAVFANVKFSNGEKFKVCGGYSLTGASSKSSASKGISIQPQKVGFKVLSDFYGATDNAYLYINIDKSAYSYKRNFGDGIKSNEFISGDFRSSTDNASADKIAEDWFSNL